MRSTRFILPTAVVLALTMVMTMGAFTTAQDGGWEAFEASLADKYAGKTLRVITINDPFQPAMEEVNKLFTELTGAEVVVDGFGYDAVYEKEQLACQQESNTYDVIVLDVPWTQAFDNCTEHLNARVEAGDPEVVAYGDYFEVMREGVEWNDEIIGLPFAPYFVLQHYNTDYFDKQWHGFLSRFPLSDGVPWEGPPSADTRQLMQNVQLVKNGLNPRLEVEGVVLTMFDGRTTLAADVVAQVREHFGDSAYRTVIPRTVRLSEAPSYGEPIEAYDPMSRGAIAYRELAREFRRRHGRT